MKQLLDDDHRRYFLHRLLFHVKLPHHHIRHPSGLELLLYSLESVLHRGRAHQEDHVEAAGASHGRVEGAEPVRRHNEHAPLLSAEVVELREHRGCQHAALHREARRFTIEAELLNLVKQNHRVLQLPQPFEDVGHAGGDLLHAVGQETRRVDRHKRPAELLRDAGANRRLRRPRGPVEDHRVLGECSLDALPEDQRHCIRLLQGHQRRNHLSINDGLEGRSLPSNLQICVHQPCPRGVVRLSLGDDAFELFEDLLVPQLLEQAAHVRHRDKHLSRADSDRASFAQVVGAPPPHYLPLRR
mmetsp:Transcript_19308/g.46643  ORF Transcript_19308/g.46643 Transcript_19308/m.46643 type:complete len:300 (-) Transcript_19308:617-1516(-)